MAAFEYTALDDRGRQRKGVLEADSVRQIRQLLRDQGLVPLGVDATTERETKTGGGGFSLALRLGALDRVLFTRQLATLIAASLPIEEALLAVAQQSEKQQINALVMGIRSRVLEGHSLEVLVGAVGHVAGGEADDSPPPALDKHGPSLVGVRFLIGIRKSHPLAQVHRPANEHLAGAK